MSADCRVAIYSQDSLGLGHLRRNIVIGATFLEAKKDSNVLLFADSPVAPFFKLPDRMDHVKLPSIRKVSAGCWEATSLRMDDRELIRPQARPCSVFRNLRNPERFPRRDSRTFPHPMRLRPPPGPIGWGVVYFPEFPDPRGIFPRRNSRIYRLA